MLKTTALVTTVTLAMVLAAGCGKEKAPPSKTPEAATEGKPVKPAAKPGEGEAAKGSEPSPGGGGEQRKGRAGIETGEPEGGGEPSGEDTTGVGGVPPLKNPTAGMDLGGEVGNVSLVGHLKVNAKALRGGPASDEAPKVKPIPEGWPDACKKLIACTREAVKIVPEGVTKESTQRDVIDAMGEDAAETCATDLKDLHTILEAEGKGVPDPCK